jgi:sugar phosphate isomerase/epimerase
MVPPEAITAARDAVARTGVQLVALSGTFNAAHPDQAVRNAGVARFPVVCEAANALGIPVITLSSGSRDPEDMWRHHPDNRSHAAWSDSRDSLAALAGIASGHGLKVAVEPEHTNVLATAPLARQMLDEIGSPALGVVFDAANVLDPDKATANTMVSVITSAAELLGPNILLSHAKELTSGRLPVPAGDGILPWDVIIKALDGAGFTGALVIHGLNEPDVARAVHTLRAALRNQHRA